MLASIADIYIYFTPCHDFIMSFLGDINKVLIPTKVNRIYLDHAAATPMHHEAVRAMIPYLIKNFGNASAIHFEGQQAKDALKEARVKVARVLQTQPAGVTFTSGGTESNNLAIRGVVSARRKVGLSLDQMEIITTKIEHPATLRTLDYLAGEGVKVHYVSVDAGGRIILSELRDLINKQTILVCTSYVNSEIGIIEDIGAVSRVLGQEVAHGQHILLYVDAAQAPLWLPCELPRHKVDLMSFDAGKFGGPKGVGILVRGKGVELEPVTFGGGQENGLRPGTEPLAQIVGCVKALEIAQQSWQSRSESVVKVRDYFIAKLMKEIPGIVINGSVGEKRIANNINISIPGIDSEFAVVVLDTHSVSASTRSACSVAGGGESTVVKAISGDHARASSTIRFTLGETTTKAELDKTVSILVKHVDELRKL